MTNDDEIDLLAAINAISDVVQNRPRPLRELDQIYMKTGDMVLQSELVARWASGKRLAFIGDGDAISICVSYLKKRNIINYGPAEIVVFDFDERICGAISRFADKEALETIRSQLYNVLDPFPGPYDFDCFYTNPPWGASNNGESVNVFTQRGMEAISFSGEGLVVIADDEELEWTQKVLSNVQSYAKDSGFFVEKMMPRMHSYHLDDAPNLRSCNLFFKALPGNKRSIQSNPITDETRLANFYGRDASPKVRYVREKRRLDYGKANDNEYQFEEWGK
jgi:N4-bis(aminopropyl)spermidine synthase